MLYVIVLSAALDLVGPNIPKGVVLLADVIPSFGMKLVAPYVIHVVPYSIRVMVFAALSAGGMLLVALTPAYTEGGSGTVSTKVAGIILASLSSGGGELSFLGLTHFYGHFSLAAWGSGTGAAGLVGAGAYALATTSLGFTVKQTLLASACLPAIMLASFFLVLPRGVLPVSGYQAVDPVDREDREQSEHDGLLASEGSKTGGLGAIKDNFKRVRGLFFPL